MSRKHILAVVVLSTCLNLGFLEAKKTSACTLAIEAFMKHREELYRDWDKDTTFNYWGRLDKIFDASNPDAITALFRDVIKGPDELETLYFAMKGGEVDLDPVYAHFVEDMYQFTREQLAKKEPLVFWEETPNRMALIQSVLKADAKLRGFNDSPSGAAEKARVVIDRTAVAVITRALEEHGGRKFHNIGFWQNVHRYFSPHYERVKQITSYFIDLHKSLSYIYLSDGPNSHALKLYEKVLTAEEVSAITRLIEETGTQFQEILTGVSKLAGQGVGIVHELSTQDIQLWDMFKRLPEARELAKNLRARKGETEKDLDKLDAVVAKLYERLHKLDPAVPEKRPFSEYEFNHLRFREEQYARETPIKKRKYYETCERSPNEADYPVKAEWTYTVHYSKVVPYMRKVRDPQTGKETEVPDTKTIHDSKTFTHPETRFVLKTNYNEIIDGEIIVKVAEVEAQLPEPPLTDHPSEFGWTTDSSSNNGGTVEITWRDQARMNWILEKANAARDVEQPRRKQIDKSISEVEGVVKGYPKNIEGAPENHKAVLAHLDALRKSLDEERVRNLEEYHQWQKGKITRNWENDIPQDFADRNTQLNDRFLHLIKRIDHLREQVLRKQVPLVIEFTDIPNYGPQYTKLDGIRHRLRVEQAWIGTAIAALIGGGIYVYNDSEDIKEWLRQHGMWAKDSQNNNQLEKNEYERESWRR